MNDQTHSPDAALARAEHHRAATELEDDGARLKEHSMTLLKLTREGLIKAAVDREKQRKDAELRCQEKEAAALKAAEEYDASCAEYERLCQRHAEAVREDGDKLLGVIQAAKDRVKARTTAILAAGESETAAAQKEGLGEPSPAQVEGG